MICFAWMLWLKCGTFFLLLDYSVDLKNMTKIFQNENSTERLVINNNLLSFLYFKNCNQFINLSPLSVHPQPQVKPLKVACWSSWTSSGPSSTPSWFSSQLWEILLWYGLLQVRSLRQGRPEVTWKGRRNIDNDIRSQVGRL